MIDTMRTEDEGPQFRSYFVDPDGAEAARRSLPVLIAGRLCYMCRQGYEDDQIVGADPQDFIDLIVGHCSTSQDFLLPDTPMKEAVFRVFLAGGNEPKDAQSISTSLSEKWAMTPFPRDTSPRVIQRLLDNSAYYCIAAVPEPEAAEDG